MPVAREFSPLAQHANPAILRFLASRDVPASADLGTRDGRLVRGEIAVRRRQEAVFRGVERALIVVVGVGL